MKRLLIYGALLLSNLLYGQETDFYQEIFDATGFEARLRHQDTLNAAAKRLADVFASNPTGTNNFKVLSANFYLHNGATKGGIPEVMEQLGSLAKRTSPYYILIGKESTELGLFQRFWVALNLPETEFPCFGTTRKAMMIETAIAEMSKVYAQNNHNPYLIAEAEKAGMQALQDFLKKSIDCCPLTNARSAPTCTCVGLDTITNTLVNKRGMLYFDVDDLTIADAAYGNIDATKNITLYNNGYFWQLTDELSILAEEMNATKDSIKVRYFDDLSCVFLEDYLDGKEEVSTAILRNNSTSDFFHEVIVLQQDGVNRVFFRFSEESRGEILDKWGLKLVAMAKSSGLYYMAVNLFFEKCLSGEDTAQKARSTSDVSSMNWINIALLLEDLQQLGFTPYEIETEWMKAVKDLAAMGTAYAFTPIVVEELLGRFLQEYGREKIRDAIIAYHLDLLF